MSWWGGCPPSVSLSHSIAAPTLDGLVPAEPTQPRRALVRATQEDQELSRLSGGLVSDVGQVGKAAVVPGGSSPCAQVVLTSWSLPAASCLSAR